MKRLNPRHSTSTEQNGTCANARSRTRTPINRTTNRSFVIPETRRQVAAAVTSKRGNGSAEVERRYKGAVARPGREAVGGESEDHPLSYANFEGSIPAGHYGEALFRSGTAARSRHSRPLRNGLAAGRLNFTLHGERLSGRFSLVRMGAAGKKEKWLLIKGRDEYARRESDSEPKPHFYKAPPRRRQTRPSRSLPLNLTVRRLQSGGGHDPQTVLFSRLTGFTKADVVAYYREVAPRSAFVPERPPGHTRTP